MKTGRIFWGVFLLALGGAFLLERFGILSLQWHHAWQWWPLALIAWGAALLVGGKVIKIIAVVVAAIILALVITVFWNFSWSCDDDDAPEGVMASASEFREDMSADIKQASFTLDSGAGTFVIEDTTAALVAATTSSSFGHYTLERSGGDCSLRFNGRHENHWFPGRFQNHADVRLNTAPTWDMHFDVGAAKLRCDLTRFKVQNLSIDCGAADVYLRLGSEAKDCTVNIDAGASSFKLAVPASVGCEMNVDAPLSSKTFPGFTRGANGKYQTDNNATASQHIFINVDAGVSSIHIERY
jgi:hypothetical protein